MATAKDLRAKSAEELAVEEAAVRKGLADASFKHANRQLEDTASLRRQRRELARVLTVKTQKQNQNKTEKK
jgi:large subunit ribosomal protein L29